MKTYKTSNLICLLSFLLFSAGIFAQGTVTGTVTDNNNLPILGATVQQQGTSNGVVTDDNGMYSIQAANGDILIFSYIGFGRKKAEVTGPTLNIQLKEDVSLLNEVVVSSTRKPVRKLQATTAINTIGTQELNILKPESFTEAIQNTPGVTIDETQGRKGGFNIRGFPGGSSYTTTLIDGLPISGTQGLTGGTQEFYGIDPSIQNIEVVRGAAATLFGRAAAAGAINIISKTGGTEHKGSFSLTKYSNNSRQGHQFEDEVDFRTDFNFNGPLTEKIRYNIGGYLLEDSGVKEQFEKDRGAQIRANFDWLITETSSIRVYGSTFNNQFQNITDAPWDLENGKILDGWHPANTFFNDAGNLTQAFGEIGVRNAFFDTSAAIDANTGNALRDNPGRNKEKARGTTVGVDFNIDLGNGWFWNERFRYNDFKYLDINEFNFSTFYDVNTTVSRFNGQADNQNRDLITEHRISKQIKGANTEHNISGGVYYSTAERDRLGLNFIYGSSVTFRNPTVGPNGFTRGSFSNPNLPSTSYVSNTSSNRSETSTAIFIGDEMVFNEKLSVNVSFRYDWLKTRFNNDPEEIRSTGINYDPGTFEENELKFKDLSYSIGANYLLGKSSAIYGNFVRAFSLPGSINLTTILPEDNEVVNNLEIGYRAGLGDLTLDFTLFNTTIDNRTATIFDGDLGEWVEQPAGANKVFGGEFSAVYTPKAIKGLLFRGAVTLSNSEYDTFLVPLSSGTDPDNIYGLNLVTTENGLQAFDIGGLKAQNRPSTIYNLNIGYGTDRWGADFGGITYSGAYADVLNLVELPTLSEYNLGAYYTFPMGKNELKVSMRIKNLFDGANARQLVVGGQDGDASLRELQANPDGIGRISSAVFQNPKRVLFTLGYTF
ncbi:TonB-dependent receptor [uncultured Maribacter sp.]|uniref:TonB-dependent receptor domain-containing protein n=1 Tax=uncultured Maribacter sp. TaxID=431308 RepID=UPI002625694A|nr:TonB-dependent receptor [uncultured Maribacter sp.]